MTVEQLRSAGSYWWQLVAGFVAAAAVEQLPGKVAGQRPVATVAAAAEVTAGERCCGDAAAAAVAAAVAEVVCVPTGHFS